MPVEVRASCLPRIGPAHVHPRHPASRASTPARRGDGRRRFRTVAAARIRLCDQRRRHRARRAGRGRGRPAAARCERHRRGPGSRRELAPRHLAQGTRVTAAHGARRRARGSTARRRGDRPPRRRALRDRGPADVDRRRRQGLAAERARPAREERRLRRSRRAHGLARRSAGRTLPRPARVGHRHDRRRLSHLGKHRRRRHGSSRRRPGARHRAEPAAGRDALDRSADGRERRRAVARRSRQRDADRAAAAASRPQPLEPASVRPRPPHPRRARARRLAAPGTKPRVASGPDRPGRADRPADPGPQPLGLAPEVGGRGAPRRDPVAGQEDLPARRRRRRAARCRRRHGTRDAIAAHARRQVGRERPRADAPGRGRRLAGRASAGRERSLRAGQASPSRRAAGATPRSISSAPRCGRPVFASTRAKAGSC